MKNKVLAVVALAGLAACSGSSSSSPPAPHTVAAPNTGYIAHATVGTQVKVYVPAPLQVDSGWQPVAVLDPASTSGGVLGYVDLGLDAQPVALGSDGNDLVVVDAGLPNVHFVDARTDALLGTTALPTGAVPFAVSNITLYASGVAVDAVRRRAWVTWSGGVAEYNLDTRVLVTTYDVPRSENFAYDHASHTLYLPFYICDPANPGGCDPYPQPGGPAQSDSLTLLDVAIGDAYTFVDPTAANTHAPLGFETDALALDPDLGVVAVAVVNPPALHILATTPTFDVATLTARLPHKLTVPMPAAEYTAVTVDPNTHLAVVAQEADRGIVFVDLAQAKQGVTRSLAFTMPDTPDSLPFFAYTDPHGATVGLVGGRPYAFVADLDRTWVARIDLQAVAALATADQAAFQAAVRYLALPATPARP